MSQPPFIASASFVGSRAGYAFKQGARGLGYYLDAPAALAAVTLPEAPPAGEGDELNDAVQAQQLVKTLARLSRANMETRSKHPGDPSKFMASEVALDEHLNKMSLLATRPDLMGGVAMALVEELAPLVAHDNDALAKDVLGLLRELTDPDNYEGESREAALKLPDTLMDADVPAALVACIDRAPLAVLEVLGNLCEIYPTAAPEHVARKAKALPWLVRAIQVSRVAGATAADARRAKAHESEEVCLAASELLAVVLAGSDWACTSLGDASNVDALLVAAARWRKKEPASSLESEWRENVWDALALVVRAGAHGVFGELEGVELALKMMPARAAARTLDYASATSEAVCCKIVDAGGLGVLFAALKAREGRKRPRGGGGADEAVPHVLAVLASLVLQLREGGVQRERVMRKLAEDGKTERLVDIRRGLCERVAAKVAELEAHDTDDKDDDDDDDGNEDEAYLERLDAGLESVQRVDVVLAAAWSAVGARAAAALDAGGMAVEDVRAVLVEMAARSEPDAAARLVRLADAVRVV